MDIHHGKMLCARILHRVRQAVSLDLLEDPDHARCASSASAYLAAADLAMLAESLGLMADSCLSTLCTSRQEQQLSCMQSQIDAQKHDKTPSSHACLENRNEKDAITPDRIQQRQPQPIGNKQAREILEEMIRLPQLVPAQYLVGIRTPPSSLLLHGPPGNGKTSLIKWAAATYKIPLFSIRPGDVLSKWAGRAEKNLCKIFATAREFSPSCIFIDECDSFCISRGHASSEESVSRSLTTTLMLLLSSVTDESSQDTPSGRVLVVAATNRLNDIDVAILRRFHRKVFVDLPDLDARSKLIKSFLNDVNHKITEKDINELAFSTESWSGADLRDLMREASLRPLRRSLACGSSDKVVPPDMSIADAKCAFQEMLQSRTQKHSPMPRAQNQPIIVNMVHPQTHRNMTHQTRQKRRKKRNSHTRGQIASQML